MKAYNAEVQRTKDGKVKNHVAARDYTDAAGLVAERSLKNYCFGTRFQAWAMNDLTDEGKVREYIFSDGQGARYQVDGWDGDKAIFEVKGIVNPNTRLYMGRGGKNMQGHVDVRTQDELARAKSILENTDLEDFVIVTNHVNVVDWIIEFAIELGFEVNVDFHVIVVQFGQHDCMGS